MVDVVKRHVELKRAGTVNWKGLCPFHAEKTPSFHVHEQRQFFHCFGCGEKGDVFSFLVKVEQRSFMEVLRDLAQQSGVELPEKTMSSAELKAMAEAESERERMLRAVELATKFFEEQLAAPAGALARAYLDSRGLTADTIAAFRVGYAPASWDALQIHLAERQVSPAIAEQLGLVGVNERGRYDFFRDRVMLPVLDRQKRPVGFSSRLLDPDAKDRKYVNSPDSPLFHKKEQLYGLPGAVDAIRRSGTAVVVEGNFDVMSLHQAGITEAVAPMGTALTAKQVSIVGKMAARVVLVFDGDEAGLRAARKALPLLLEDDVDGRVAQMPPRVDPDDFVRQQGADAFRKLIDGARPVVEQFIDDVAGQADTTIPGRVQALEEAVQVLAKVRNPTARELYVGRLAGALGVSTQQATRALRGAMAWHSGAPRREARTEGSVADPAAVADAAAAPPVRTPPRDELETLLLLVARPELGRLPEAARVLELLIDPGVRQVYRNALEALQKGERADVPAWLDRCPDDIRAAVGSAIMDGRYDGLEGADRVLRSLVARLERSRIDAELAQANRLHLEALARGDENAARAISLREMELIRTKQGLSEARLRP